MQNDQGEFVDMYVPRKWYVDCFGLHGYKSSF